MPGEVHVWRARLDQPWSWTMEEALSRADRERADRFRFESDRRRFCVARAAMRLILGRYLKMKPGRLQIEPGKCGKPYLTEPKTAHLRFNLSHSHRLALLAVTTEREIGIDVEYMRPDFVTDEVAEHFFSRAEVEQFRAVPFEAKTEAFFKCWTRKEAYIKARGEGLYCPLDQFDVSFRPGDPCALLDSRVEPHEVSRWSFEELFAEPGYAVALAVEGKWSRIKLWDM